jgi:hypothetical protein
MTKHGRGFVVIAAMILTGCGNYYYAKPGTAWADFSGDSIACTREFGTALPDQQRAVVEPEAYQGCMTARGWVRERRADPAGAGWFRGVEDREPVSLVQGPAQVDETRALEDARVMECWRRYAAGNRRGRDPLPWYHKCVAR